MASCLLVIVAAVSCANPRVVDEDRLEWVNTKRTERTNSFVWGLWRDSFKLSDSAASDELQLHGGVLREVNYQQSVLESLAAVVTLGIWMPGRIEWTLAAPPLAPLESNRKQHDFEVPQEGPVDIRVSSANRVSIKIKERGTATSLPRSDDDLLGCRGLRQGSLYVAECQAELWPSVFWINVQADDGEATYDVQIDQGGDELLKQTNQEI